MYAIMSYVFYATLACEFHLCVPVFCSLSSLNGVLLNECAIIYLSSLLLVDVYNFCFYYTNKAALTIRTHASWYKCACICLRYKPGRETKDGIFISSAQKSAHESELQCAL